MADITVTAGSVIASSTALRATGVAGATITAGQPVYIDTANGNVLKPTDSNASLLAATVAGIALNGGSTGQPIAYVYEDPDFTPGATLVTGTVYGPSSTAGGICPNADLTTGDYPSVLFIAKSTSKAVMKIVRAGVAK